MLHDCRWACETLMAMTQWHARMRYIARFGAYLSSRAGNVQSRLGSTPSDSHKAARQLAARIRQALHCIVLCAGIAALDDGLAACANAGKGTAVTFTRVCGAAGLALVPVVATEVVDPSLMGVRCIPPEATQ